MAAFKLYEHGTNVTLKRVVKKKDVPFVWGSTSLEPSVLNQFKELEAQMHAADKLVMDTEVRILWLCSE